MIASPAFSSAASSTRLMSLLAWIQIDAGNLVLRRKAIREACECGCWNIARKLIDDGPGAHPGEAWLMSRSDVVHVEAQRYPEAERDLSCALSRGMDTSDLGCHLARAKFMQKRYAEALEHLPRNAPRVSARAYVLRARCLHQMDRGAEAAAECETLLRVMPDDPEANGLCGLLLQEQGKTEKAMPFIDAALRQDPNQLDAMLAGALLQTQSQDHAAARQTYDLLLNAYPECGRAWLERALMELTDMQIDAAQRYVELAATHLADHIAASHVGAWVQIIDGDLLSAEVAFHRALALDRNHAETHAGLGVIACLRGQERSAEMSVERALQLDPESISARYAGVLLLRHRGHKHEAQAMLDALLAQQATPKNLQYQKLVRSHTRFEILRLGVRASSSICH